MQSITNQKVLFAQSQLDSLVDALENIQNPRDQLLARGFADACVYHLMGVWRALLQEIISNYKVQGFSPSYCLGASMLVECMDGCEREDTISPELSYIFELSKKPPSCIAQLQVLFEQALSGSLVSESGQKGAENLIVVQQLDCPDPLSLQRKQLESILVELKELVQYCRQTMQEY